ncbi:metallophosphatase domain-containing protein [Sphingobacterium sp. PU5-4]|uniref:Metallophosphatase domain-containing protein n=1 Tax=Sphingobacterium tenebrionis TaxID=3111775 RepID=A0ABU8I5W1_9SPHI
MQIVAVSDTHGKHRDLKIPDGDVFIHAGDVTRGGTKEQVVDFLEWFAEQTHTHKTFVAGNHDFFFEQADSDMISSVIPDGIIYLNDSSIEINGVKFWGSPITPWFNNWAFNRNRGSEIKKHWDLIPNDIDVLITHGPPFGILDETVYGNRTGCEDLLLRVEQVKPKFHIFGHIHEEYGTSTEAETTFVNASVLDDWYEMKNQPKILNICR